MAQWIECWLVRWGVAGSIPNWGTCLGCGQVPGWEYTGVGAGSQLVCLLNIAVSLPFFLPPFSSL